MRICFVMPPQEFFSPVSGGAIATVTRHVAAGLGQHGHRVCVVTPDAAQPLYTDCEVWPVPMTPLHGGRAVWGHLRARLRGWEHPQQGVYWREVSRIFSRVQPDVVVLANDLAGATEVRRMLPAACVVSWVHNECRLPPESRACLKHSDLFLCCSDYIRTWFIEEYGVDSGRVVTAHAGVDHSVFFPSTQEPEDGLLRLLFLGRLDPNKGVDLAVEATRRVRQAGASVELTVAGHTWFYHKRCASSEAFLDALRGAMRGAGAHWIGHVPRAFVPCVYRQHDVALVLSRSAEPYGLVVLEAMASGLAVVASPRGGLPEACGGGAHLVDPDKMEDITRVLMRFHERRDELVESKRKAVDRASRAQWAQTVCIFLHAVGEVRG